MQAEFLAVCRGHINILRLGEDAEHANDTATSHHADGLINRRGVAAYRLEDSVHPVTIGQGEKVTWNNTGGSHSVVFDDGSFAMPPQPSSMLWSHARTFTTPGSFTYHCGNPAHDAMTGIVRVTAAPPPSDPGGGGGGSDPGSPGGSPPGGSPGSPTRPEVTLKVSNTEPRAGRRVRFFGFVTPALDGEPVHIQRRARSGRFQTVAKLTLRDAGATRSRYSKRIRIFRDGVFRARVPAEGERESATSARRRLDVRTARQP